MPNLQPQKASKQQTGHNHHWHHADWDDENCQYARQLLRRSRGRFGGFSNPFERLGHRILDTGWIRKTLITIFVVGGVFGLGFFSLWLRLGAGPISLDMVTPWLVSAIEQNLGEEHTVEIGGTQIERAGRIRVAVRVRDLVVRDRNHAIVASAPKAEVRLSGVALMLGKLRAESLRLVDAELSVRITPDGDVIVTTAGTTQPLATARVPVKPVARIATPPAGGATPSAATPAEQQVAANAAPAASGLLAVMGWLDAIGSKGLDGQSLNEIGLRNGSLLVDDQQSKTKVSFDNISLSLRRPSSGGVTMTVGEEGTKPWSLRIGVGAPENGVRPIELALDKVPTKNLLLAARLKDFNYTTEGMALSGRMKGQVGRDGLPTYLSGEFALDKGQLIDRGTPDYPMNIDRAEVRLDWDAARRVMVAPLQITSGANRLTLLAHLEAPADSTQNWQLGLSGGTILLTDPQGENPVIFNRIAVRLMFDPDHRRVVMTHCDFSNGDTAIAGSATLDYSTPEARLQLGLAATPMSASVFKNIWPILVVPEARQWVIDRISGGTLQHLDIAVNAPLHTLARGGPPIPDGGLSVDFTASNVALHPLDAMPSIHDADMQGHVSGRTVKITIGQGGVDTPAGRKLTVSDVSFQIPDLVPKPAPTVVRFRVDGPVAAAAEVLQSDRLSDVSTGVPIDPNTSKGNVSALVTLNMPLKNALTKEDTKYAVSVDVGGLSVDKLAMNQKVEASALKVVADNDGYRVKGDVKIAGQPAMVDYHKDASGDADVRLATTLDDSARAKLGVDLGSSVSGAIPIKLSGKIANGDSDSRFGVEADLTATKIDNILPGWTKIAGKASKLTFNVVKKPQSTRFEDISIEGSGTAIKGAVEVDQNNDLISAIFPTFAPSEGDKASLRAERGPDGALKVTLRGDVFDGRGLVKSGMSGNATSDPKSKAKLGDIDIDAKVGAIAGFYGEAIRAVDIKFSRRNGTVRSFALSGKLGRDTPLNGSLRSRGQGRDLLFVETADAGALFRFTDTYSKMVGGQMWIAMDAPTADATPQEGLLNVSNFVVKGESSLDNVVNGGNHNGNSPGIAFTRMRTEFTRETGQLRVKDGVVRGPAVGATIEGSIDYAENQVRMSGTFVPIYGLNNIFGQIPIVGLVLGGGSNEGLIGVTYEVVGTPGAPVLRVNPISAMAPGVLRKIFDFNTGKQQNLPPDFPSAQSQ
ncbi:MAG: DUF3971 domain-containing protein [Xanthobacteraceae bacterium]|nr:DUF3971 domain-containing protein [Xanthobacteraceae bacterium]